MNRYFSIFGFDILKPAYRQPAGAGDQQTQANTRAPAKLRSIEDGILDNEHPEIFLWGMYPIY